MSDSEIAAQVRALVADVSGCEIDEVSPEQTFFGDLGNESIDFLDLGFRLEKHFGTKIPINQLQSRADLSIDEQGLVTPDGLQMLRQKLPFLDFTQFQSDPRAELLSDLITIEAITLMVEYFLAKDQANVASDPS